jgi:hypothetical protein
MGVGGGRDPCFTSGVSRITMIFSPRFDQEPRGPKSRLKEDKSMRRRQYPAPAQGLTLDKKLEEIAKAFKKNLVRVAGVAANGKGKAQQYAADGTAGMPKKHVVAATFALCEETLNTQLGTLWWRCSMSESKKKGEPVATKVVKTILAAIEELPSARYDEWPPIEEFMHDFSASSHSIPQITGKDNEYTWDNKPFQLVFTAESEMKSGGLDVRAHAITRDLIKLCLVECPIKAVVYRGYDDKWENANKRTKLNNAIVETIMRCPSPGNRNEGWLLVGLSGKWPNATTPYFYTLRVGEAEAKFQGW